MQDPRGDDVLVPPKPVRRKPASQKFDSHQGTEIRMGHKRNSKPEASPYFQQPERSNSDSSASGNEYRTLRRKYLLLEDESTELGRELREVEDDVKTLEEEKSALLDQLVVLEGLIDPSQLQPHGQPSRSPY